MSNPMVQWWFRDLLKEIHQNVYNGDIQVVVMDDFDTELNEA